MASITHETEAVEVSNEELTERDLKRRPFYAAFIARRYQQARRLCYSDLLDDTSTHAVGQAYVNVLLDAFAAGKRGGDYLAKLLSTEECTKEEIPESHWEAVTQCDIDPKDYAKSTLQALDQAIGLATERELVSEGEVKDKWSLMLVTFLQARARVRNSLFMDSRSEEHFQSAIDDLTLSGQVHKSIASVPMSSEHCALLGFLFISAAGLQQPGEHRNHLLAEAAHHFDDGLKITPEEPELWYGKGLAQQEGGNLAAATELFGQATKVAEQYAPAWLARGGCHLALRNAWEAAADFTQYLKHAAEYYAVTGQKDVTAPEVLGTGLLRRGVAYYRIEDFDMSASDFKHCIELGHDPSRAHHLLGKIRAKEGNWWDCIVENTKSLEIQLSPWALDARATAYEAIGKTEEAERDRRQLGILRSQRAYTEP